MTTTPAAIPPQSSTPTNASPSTLGILGGGQLARMLVLSAAQLGIECRVVDSEPNGCAAEVADLYDNAPCGYHSLDKDGVFLRVNQTELNWLGYQREELIGKVQAALDTLKETLKGEDMEKIKADTEALTKPLYELSAELYKQTEAAKGAEGTETAEGAKKADDDVVDAEVVDEDKK